MMSSIVAFYLVAAPALLTGQSMPLGHPGADSPSYLAEADELYGKREDPASAKRALELYAARAESARDFEAAWKAARACYWLGTRGPERERRAALERGIKAGELAVAIEASKPEGYYWQAANMGALAESFGFTQGLKYRGAIKERLQKVIAIDPAWLQGSGDRALGWWYHKVPGLFGGSEEKAELHLRRAMTYNPRSTATLYFLAEVVLERGRKDDARQLLQQVLEAPVQPDWAPEDTEFQRKAAARLQEITRKARPLTRFRGVERTYAGRVSRPGGMPDLKVRPPYYS
jgi:hypothetical protein